MEISNKDSKKQNQFNLNDKYSSLINEFKTQLIIGSKRSQDKHNTISFSSQNMPQMLKDLDSNSIINSHPNYLQLLKDSKIKASNENIIIAFINTISKFIGEDDKEKTLRGLNVKIKEASEHLFVCISQQHLISEGRSTITLKAVSEIIIHMINKHISKNLSEDFNSIKNSISTLCSDLLHLCEGSKSKISKFFRNAMRTGMSILVHGYSTTLFRAIVDCKNAGININVFVTQCSPEQSGLRMKKELTENGVKCNIILDLSVGYYMKDVDCVVVGSNALCENGGLINRIGTFTLAICAKSFKKPFYVLSECLKFLKLYPLEQGDIPFNHRLINPDSLIPDHKTSTNTNINDVVEEYSEKDHICDYTPPEFINLLFTDIGIFTPSALSDELIQMFYD